MHRLAHRPIRSCLAVLVVALAAACSPAEETTDQVPQRPFPAGSGIQQGLSLTSLERGGWTVCYEDTYDTFGPDLGSVLAGCVGEYLAIGCRSGTADLLAVAAADLATVVTQADAATATAHHVANGVGWYFTSGFSWGFFPAGDTVNRNPCDSGTQTQEDKRLCWELSGTGELKEGYRCGVSTGLATSGAWQRLVLAHP